MSLFIYNTPCPFCGNPINEKEQYISFPPFISNKLDPLFVLNDATVHEKCYKTFEYYNESQNILSLYKSSIFKGFMCCICKNKITNFDDIISIGYLTSDKNNLLYKFNYLNMHKSCVKNDSHIADLIFHLEQLLNSNKWSGDGLSKVIDELKRQNQC